MFATFDGAIKIAVWYKKPSTVALAKWLGKNGVKNIPEEDQPTITGIQSTHQQALEAIQYENFGLQGELQAKEQEIERYENAITNLRGSYVDHERDPDKGNIIIIMRKHTISVTNKYRSLP